jgi:hypothetical protein
MAYARERQERYIKTEKGKACTSYAAAAKDIKRKNVRATDEGRMILRLRKIKCKWGQSVADWYKEQKPMCQSCGKSVLKAPKNSQSKQDQAVIDHDHTYTAKRI